ncbi:unnamed protein product [Plutella xylostella]|uniref:(diamondback moth) hypothetical protein n=1 Tax=Plutella xylostella TaxID=51655 RepID=A0A8S4EL47_PLUXY|nr:unnamed protein product [Plutella xylostella]
MRRKLAMVLLVYTRECTTRRDAAEMWAGLSQVRAARADEQEEEELMRKRLCRECTTRRDAAEMWAGLSQVRAARADEQEEELMRKRLW